MPGRAPLAHATLEAENTALKEELARERKQRIALNTRVRNLNGEPHRHEKVARHGDG